MRIKRDFGYSRWLRLYRTFEKDTVCHSLVGGMGCVFLCEMTEYNSDLTGVLAVLEFIERNNV